MTKVHSMVKAPTYVLSTLSFWSTMIMHRLDILFCHELSIYPTKIMRHCDKSINVNAALNAPVSCDWKAAATAKCDIDHLSSNWLFLHPTRRAASKTCKPWWRSRASWQPKACTQTRSNPRRRRSWFDKQSLLSSQYNNRSKRINNPWSQQLGNCQHLLLYSELKMQNGCEWIPILFQGKSTWDSQEITGRWGNWKKENDPLSSKCNSILGLL